MGFVVQVARKPKERDKSYQVRYQVFIRELGFMPEKDFPDEREKDPYDELASTIHFLALLDGAGVGTARLIGPNKKMTGSGGLRTFGLPMEELFDLSSYREQKIVPHEISRSSVLSEARCSRIIMDIWRISIQYAKQNGIASFCSCAGTETDSPEDAGIIHSLLKLKNHIHPRLETRPLGQTAHTHLPRYILYDPDLKKEIREKNGLSHENLAYFENKGIKLPATLEYFIKIGAKFSGPPALFPAFTMFTVPMILDLNSINEPFKTFFGRESPSIIL